MYYIEILQQIGQHGAHVLFYDKNVLGSADRIPTASNETITYGICDPKIGYRHSKCGIRDLKHNQIPTTAGIRRNANSPEETADTH